MCEGVFSHFTDEITDIEKSYITYPRKVPELLMQSQV